MFLPYEPPIAKGVYTPKSGLKGIVTRLNAFTFEMKPFHNEVLRDPSAGEAIRSHRSSALNMGIRMPVWGATYRRKPIDHFNGLNPLRPITLMNVREIRFSDVIRTVLKLLSLQKTICPDLG
jgi:hypothetical protein